MEEKLPMTRRKKVISIIMAFLFIYFVLQLIYKLAQYHTIAFVLGVITGILFGVWILVTYGRLQIEDFQRMEKIQDMILEQNMVLLGTLERIGAIEKDDSEDLR